MPKVHRVDVVVFITALGTAVLAVSRQHQLCWRSQLSIPGSPPTAPNSLGKKLFPAPDSLKGVGNLDNMPSVLGG